MAKYDSAGLAMIPSGYKASKVYSLIPNSSDGDFDFARSSSATRVNKDGLIETVATNVPRLDYPLIDGVVQDTPSLLLEPSRSNVYPYSEDLSSAATTRCNITSNDTISPNGSQDADLFVSNDALESYTQLNGTVDANFTWSFFVKKGNNNYVHGLSWDLSQGGVRQWFNLTTKTVGTNGTFGSGYSVQDASIEDYGNGWYRCSMTVNGIAGANGFRVSVGS